MSMTYNDIRKELENYFSGPDTSLGLCATLGWYNKDRIHKYAEKWPLTPRRDEDGSIQDYYIPLSRTALDWGHAKIKYENDFKKQIDPLRKEFANFFLAGIAAEEGVEHTPIL